LYNHILARLKHSLGVYIHWFNFIAIQILAGNNKKLFDGCYSVLGEQPMECPDGNISETVVRTRDTFEDLAVRFLQTSGKTL
jgi:hypothetical protein